MNVVEAKQGIELVLFEDRVPEDFAMHTGLTGGVFERMVHLVEDRDPHWLLHQLHDQRFDRSVRCEVAGFMRGVGANKLVLELLDA